MLDTIVDVIEAVEEQWVDKGIVPIENAIEGYNYNDNRWLMNYDVKIVGEAILPVALHLLAVPGAQIRRN